MNGSDKFWIGIVLGGILYLFGEKKEAKESPKLPEVKEIEKISSTDEELRVARRTLRSLLRKKKSSNSKTNST